MTLSLVLSHPALGVYSPPVVSGTLTHAIDRYPRMGFTATIRPEPSGATLLQTPYGTTAQVFTRDGMLMFTGPVTNASTRRPDGQWELAGQDPISYMSAAKFSERKGQYISGGAMSVPAWIRAVADAAGIGTRIIAGGSGGTVTPAGIDLAGNDAWRCVEDQLIANNVDVWVQPNGTLMVGPSAAMKTVPDKRLAVGEQGTIVAYDLSMERIYNKIIITHICKKESEEDRYLDGVWEDLGSYSGVTAIGPNVLTKSVDVGEDWWADPAAKQVQANGNAAAAAQQLRGTARTVDVEAIPDYAVKPGMTLDVMYSPGKRDPVLVTSVEFPMEPGPMRITGRNSAPDTATTLIRRN